MGVKEANEMLNKARKKQAESERIASLNERKAIAQNYSDDRRRVVDEKNKREKLSATIGTTYRTAKIGFIVIGALLAAAICFKAVATKPPTSSAKLIADASALAGTESLSDDAAVRKTITDLVGLAAQLPKDASYEVAVKSEHFENVRQLWDPFADDAAVWESLGNLQRVLSTQSGNGVAVKAVTFDSKISRSKAVCEGNGRQCGIILSRLKGSWRVSRVD